MSIEQRWRQRFANYQKAFSRLERALEQEEFTELEETGVIKTFEYTFELGWKLMKDIVEFEGHTAKGSKDAIRVAFEIGLLDHESSTQWLDMVEKRNMISHDYDEDDIEEILELITESYFDAMAHLDRVVSDRASSAEE